MPCSWEGNRRSGVPLAMRHRLQWFIHVRTRSRSKKGGEHPACTDQITIISRRRGRLNGRATDRLCLASSFILFHRMWATHLGNQRLAPACMFFTIMGVRTYVHTHTHTFNGPFSGTTQVSRYQKGKTGLDFTEAREREWQWHQLGHMQVCTSLQTDNHASTPPLSFYRPDALPVAQPTASKHWRPSTCTVIRSNAGALTWAVSDAECMLLAVQAGSTRRVDAERRCSFPNHSRPQTSTASNYKPVRDLWLQT